MKALALATLIRTNTRTNTNTLPDSVMLPWVQTRMDELSRRLMNGLNTDEDIFLTPETANLVSSDTSREYGFPTDLLSRVKRIEAKLDGTNWVRLYPLDMNEYSGTHDEPNILANFNSYQFSAAKNTRGAQYDIRRKAIFIYSGTIVAGASALKLWVFDYPTVLTDLTENTLEIEDDPTTTTHGFPRELHELLARGVTITYKESREKPIPLTQTEQFYDRDVERAIATLRNGDLSREIIATLPPPQQRGNNGQDY